MPTVKFICQNCQRQYIKMDPPKTTARNPNKYCSRRCVAMSKTVKAYGWVASNGKVIAGERS